MPPNQPRGTAHARRRGDGLKPTWKPDSSTRVCSGCKVKFTLTLRRHHCRRCGNIFCKNCAAERRVLNGYGYGPAPQRLCLLCMCFDEAMLQLQLEESDERRQISEGFVWSWQKEVTVLLGLTIQRVLTGNGNPTVVLEEPATPSPSGRASTESSCASPNLTQPDSSVPAHEEPDSQRTRDLFVDAALVRAAVGFVDIVSSPLTGLRKTRRMNLKLQKDIFSQPDIAGYFTENVPSIDIEVFWEILKRAGLFDFVTEKCYRFNDGIVARCRELLEPENPTLQVGSIVVDKSRPVAELVITDIRDGGDEEEAVLLRPNSDVVVKKLDELEMSPFAGVTKALPKLLCGTVKDIDGELIELGEVRSEFVRIALLFMKHIAHNLSNSDETFNGEPVVDWLTTSWDLSTPDAIDLCEVFHRIGLFSLVPTPSSPTVFDGSASQVFRPTPSIVKSLEDTLECVKPMTALGTHSKVTGNTVLVIQPGGNKHREGHVVEGLKNNKIKVQFSNGDSWVFSDHELISSPAVEVLELTKDEGAGLTNTAVGNLARMFGAGMQKHIKKIQWQGVSRYTNAFNSDDAIQWVTNSFPSLSATNAIDVLELLRKAGLFAHGMESEASAPLKRNNYYKFQPGAMKLLDQHLIEAKGQDTDVSRILHEVLVKGTIRRNANKARERRQSQPPVSTGWETTSPSLGRGLGLPSTRRRPGSLPVSNFDGLLDVVKEGFVMRKGESGKWGLQRYVLMGDGVLERHAPRIRVISGTRLRKVPKDDGDVWIEPPTNVEVDELLSVLSPATPNGYQRVKREGVEGYIRCFNMTSIPALHSSLKTADIEARPSSETPSGPGWEFGMVLRDGRAQHHLAFQTESDRDRWLDVITTQS